MSISLSALAQHVGVSLSTASRALNGYADVNAQTRARIVDAAERFGYRPHAIARTLATGKTGVIGLVTSVENSNEIDASLSSLLAGVSDVTSEHGYSVVAAGFPMTDATHAAFRQFAASGLVDGIILARTQPNDGRMDVLKALKLPFVAYGRTHANDHPWVDVDNEGVFALATQRLLDFGHTRIAFLNASLDFNFARLREEGVRRAAAGSASCELTVLYGETSAQAGFERAKNLLANATPPTAILCATDALALGAMAAVREHDGVVGKDVSIIGYGNSEAARFATPGLTSIEQHTRENGALLGKFLMQRLQEGPGGELAHLVSTRIVARSSDGPAQHSKFFSSSKVL